MNLRGFKRVRSLGIGTMGLLFLVVAMIAQGAELKQFMSYQQPDRTELVFELDAPTPIPAPREEGLDLVLRLEGVDVTALPQQADVQTPQVARIVVDHTAHEIRIQRTRLLPFEFRMDGPRAVVVIREVQARVHPTPPMKEKASVEEKSKPSSPTARAAHTVQKAPVTEPGAARTAVGPVTVEALQILSADRDGVSLLIQTTGATRLEHHWAKLTNPVRWVLDLSPARFRPDRWKQHPDIAEIKEIRAAQYKTDPIPITRIVFEMAGNVGKPDLVVQEHELIARLDLKPGPAVAQVPAPAAPTESVKKPETALTAAPSEAVPEVVEQSIGEEEKEPTQEVKTGEAVSEPTPIEPVKPSSEVTETASPSSTVEPSEPEGTPAEFHNKPANLPAQEETEQPAVDPEFFSTKDIMFYQAEGEKTPEETKRLAIFEERAISGQKKYEGEPISLKFTNIEITDLMTFFSDISGLNIVLDPSVQGPQYQIPLLNLIDVPWDQAFDLVCRMLGLGYILEGNVLRVAPVDVLAREAEERAKLTENVGELVTITKPLSFASAEEVKSLAEQLLTPRGEILIDKRTNTLIIKETDQNINNITNLIDTLDKPIPQVNIEARIVQTRRTFSQALGIQWGFRGLVSPALGNQTSLVFPNNISVLGNTLVSQTGGIGGNPLGGYAVNLPTQQAPNAAILLSFGSVMDTFRLDAALMALENQGLARVLQSPRVSTQNNKEAIIKSGFQIPVQTIVNNTIQVRFVDATLSLRVTPQITADGSVIMDVKIENKRPDFTQPVLGIPPILTQEASTTLLVKDGETAVLGGIIQSQDEVSHGRVPWFHRIPILGWLFKNKNITRSNDELLIFLTPRIVK